MVSTGIMYVNTIYGLLVDKFAFTVVGNMAQPRKLNAEAYKEVYAALVAYIADTDDPIIAEFLATNDAALKHWLELDDLSSPTYPGFRPVVNRLMRKSEAYMLRKGMNGQSTGMSIFRLKQPWHGYRDKFEQDITSNGEKVVFSNTLPRPAKTDKKPARTV